MGTGKPNKLRAGAVACMAFGMVILILLFPRRSFEAALNGLSVWLDVVLPALLPFFIVSEIMIGLGIVDFLSVLLNPIMNPLFRCPGSSSFIWVMSIISGYPMGARLVSSFYHAGKITREEGQRILAFCSTSGPLFMIGAVGIGMLGSSEAGKLIAFSHYLASIILGLIYRFYRSSKSEHLLEFSERTKNIRPRSLLSQAFKNMISARSNDGRSFGELMGDAVRNSMNSLFLVGGFIVLFSVILNLLLEAGLIQAVSNAVHMLIPLDPSHSNLIHGIFAGLLEVTMGCKMVSDSMVSLSSKLIAVSFLIGWSGFSIHSQAAGLLGKTSLSIPLYLLTKLGHGLLSGFITWASITIYYKGDISAFAPYDSIINPKMYLSRLNILASSMESLLIIILTLALLSLATLILIGIQSNISHKKTAKKTGRL